MQPGRIVSEAFRLEQAKLLSSVKDMARELNFILFRRGAKFVLAACRGESKGCNVKLKQRQKLGPCSDCIICEDGDETLEQIAARIARDS